LPLTIVFRTLSAADVLLRIEERLARVEDSLRSAVSVDSVSTPGSLRRTSFETTAHPSRLKPPEESRQFFQRIVAEPSNYFNFRQTAGEAATPRPSIVSFHSPYYLHFDTWDDTKQFYDSELAAEEQLFEAMEAGSGQGLDMTPRTVWQLQQNFVLNYLQWMPLLDVSTFSLHIETAQNGQFSQQGPSDCLVLFALAVGTLDRNRQTTTDPDQLELYPGLRYFQEGRQILMSLSRAGRKNITILQC
jgi:hypothetical protein